MSCGIRALKIAQSVREQLYQLGVSSATISTASETMVTQLYLVPNPIEELMEVDPGTEALMRMLVYAEEIARLERLQQAVT